MSASQYIDEQWRAELHRSLDSAVEAVRRQEPRATDEMIEPMVRKVGQAAITSWRSDAAIEGPRNSGWDRSMHESLDRMIDAVKQATPEVDENAAIAVVRQGAQATLDEWHLH